MVPKGKPGLSMSGLAQSLFHLEAVREASHLDLQALEKFIATCMEEIYALSLSGANNTRKMKIVRLEYRARMLRDEWKRRQAN